ncbi:MAG: hypothetical protein VKJ02_16975 [Snowella sp.]|nr:hypothetical protein [Snowella sp.]
MRLPPVQIISNSEYFVSGDVTIHETAVIAPGVILQAAPHSQIMIGEGVCLGKGTVINAYAGNIDIETGATLGAGVLIIGRARIGQDACVGALSTILNTNIESLSLIPPGSLLGDTSRTWEGKTETNETESLKEQPIPNSPVSSTEIPSPWDTDEQDTTTSQETSEQVQPPSVPNKSETELQPEVEPETLEFVPNPIENKEIAAQKTPVVGQVYINQLLVTLFPEREAFRKATQKE